MHNDEPNPYEEDTAVNSELAADDSATEAVAEFTNLVTHVAVGSNNVDPNTGGIEILVQMAERNEIDPKNIDIIDVTDRFLKAIAAQPKENLRQSGKILFHASVLLRMKAEALLVLKFDELDFGGDDFVDFGEDGSTLIYDANQQPIARQITLADLEKALVRRTKLRQLRQRRVTLDQLIEALREAENVEKSREDKKGRARIDLSGYSEMKDMDDLLDLAHDEDIEDVILRVEHIIMDCMTEGDLMSLLVLIEKLGGRGDWVDAFLAVLFISNAGKIGLAQKEFYGPLYLVRGGEEVDSEYIDAKTKGTLEDKEAS